MKQGRKAVQEYYDQVAGQYHDQYDGTRIFDIKSRYPANYFRLQLLLNSFINKKIHRVIEVGVGEGTPISMLARAGIDVWGFDISQEMVQKSKKKMSENNLDPEKIFWGDIQDPTTDVHSLKEGQFDGLMAMGVMPHISNDDMVLENISTLVRPGGSVFIEFRNKLFSLFTFNRYTRDFILDDLLAGVNEELKEIVAEELNNRLRTDMPPVRKTLPGSKAPGYDAILSRFHNPFEIHELFEKHNFSNINLMWYHYHPAIPYLADRNPRLFRQEAIRLEHDPHPWRGLFLCSAFVVEAERNPE